MKIAYPTQKIMDESGLEFDAYIIPLPGNRILRLDKALIDSVPDRADKIIADEIAAFTLLFARG